MRVNVAIPEQHVDAPVLDAALESVTRLNESLLKQGEAVPFERGLKRGIRWQPEPPGQEHFDNASIVMQRGHGDCDDLAPWHAASLRHSGEDPGAKAVVYKSGPKRWHAVVRRSNGDMDDPSKRAGMGQPRGNRGAAVPALATASGVNGAYQVRPQIAMRPVYGAWQARADIPWQWQEHRDRGKPSPADYAMTTLHTAPVASTALVGAIEGAIELAEAAGFADPEHLERLECLADACEGMPYEELLGEYGPEHADAAQAVVGSLFGSMARMARKALPFVSKAISFIPGIGPVASTALDVADKLIPRDHPKHPLNNPTGPLAAQMMAPLAMKGMPGANLVPGGGGGGGGMDPRMFGGGMDPRMMAAMFGGGGFGGGQRQQMPFGGFGGFHF